MAEEKTLRIVTEKDHAVDHIRSSPTHQKFNSKDVRKRSHTVSSNDSSGSSKSIKSQRADYSKNRRSTFYYSSASTDVTTPFVSPMMEMDSLNVSNRSPADLLDLMTKVLQKILLLM